MNNRVFYISLTIVPIVAILVGLAGSQGGQEINGLPIFAICVVLAFLINVLAFIPSYFSQTEKYYDITGSLTYITVTIFALVFSENLDLRSLLLGTLVLIWTIRLGTFLFRRIQKAGKDDRFDKLKPSIPKFLNAWFLQALWVTLTAAPAFIAINSSTRQELGILGFIGLAIWLIGFTIEVVADYQKNQFRKDPANQGKFIQTGLWSRSRHPNYLGEIILWMGITLIAIPAFEGWQWIGVISPVFVTILLTQISGIPMLEEKADKKWGGQADYEEYKADTPVLLLKI